MTLVPREEENQGKTKKFDDKKKTESKEEDMKSNWKKQKVQLAHSMVGTPDYMAPEIFTHYGYNEECDWWGVGCIMFECLAGYAPFYSGGECDIQDTVHNVRHWQKVLNLEKIKHKNKDAADLVGKLICDHKNRLNFEGIKKHKFFASFNWDDVQKNVAPYHNEKLTDIEDTRFFQSQDDSEDSEDEENKVAQPVKKIDDFTYYVSDKENPRNHVTDLWLQSTSSGK